MASLNRVVVLGNLTKDPELRFTPSGVAVCSMRLAVNDREKVGDMWQDRANFFDIVAFGSQGEACGQRLARGSQICVDGKLRFEEWEKEGQRRSTVKIVASRVQFLARSQGAGDSDAQPGVDGEFAAPSAEFEHARADFSAGVGTDDDIPF